MDDADDDAARLLSLFDALGLSPLRGRRGWGHMGAVLSDAALQRRSRYLSVVKPRILALIASWPDAETVAGFARRMVNEDVGAVLRWRAGPKLRLLQNLTDAMAELNIETVDDLRTRLADGQSADVRARLQSIRDVGPKTVDYLAILAGSEEDVAVDSHLRAFAAEARLRDRSYAGIRQTVVTAAGRRGWTPTSVEGAIYQHMSNRNRRLEDSDRACCRNRGALICRGALKRDYAASAGSPAQQA